MSALVLPSLRIDAFTHWPQAWTLLCTCPPVLLIPCFLDRVWDERLTVILIAPERTNASWFPYLQSMWGNPMATLLVCSCVLSDFCTFSLEKMCLLFGEKGRFFSASVSKGPGAPSMPPGSRVVFPIASVYVQSRVMFKTEASRGQTFAAAAPKVLLLWKELFFHIRQVSSLPVFFNLF